MSSLSRPGRLPALVLVFALGLGGASSGLAEAQGGTPIQGQGATHSQATAGAQAQAQAQAQASLRKGRFPFDRVPAPPSWQAPNSPQGAEHDWKVVALRVDTPAARVVACSPPGLIEPAPAEGGTFVYGSERGATGAMQRGFDPSRLLVDQALLRRIPEGQVRLMLGAPGFLPTVVYLPKEAFVREAGWPGSDQPGVCLTPRYGPLSYVWAWSQVHTLAALSFGGLLTVGLGLLLAMAWGLRTQRRALRQRRVDEDRALSRVQQPGPLTGVRLGAWLLLDRLGEGASAVVYAAVPVEARSNPGTLTAALGVPSRTASREASQTVLEQSSADGVVALKILKPEALARPQARARLAVELAAAATLRHPNIALLLASGEEQGRYFLVFSRLSGGTLRDRLREGPISQERALAWLLALTRALAYAHAQGIVHRDLKPENVLFDEHDHPYLTDFGLALKASAPTSAEPQEVVRGAGATSRPSLDQGAVPSTPQAPPGSEFGLLGSLGYAAPEVVLGEEGDPQAEQYALGVLAYELLAGVHPFFVAPSLSGGEPGSEEIAAANHPLAVVGRQLQGQVRPLLEVMPDLPRPLATVVETMLALAAAERYPGMRAVEQALEEVLGEQQATDPGR